MSDLTVSMLREDVARIEQHIRDGNPEMAFNHFKSLPDSHQKLTNAMLTIRLLTALAKQQREKSANNQPG